MTAMLKQFGTADGAEFRQIMMGVTGFGVNVIVLGMAVYMMVHGTKTIKSMMRFDESSSRVLFSLVFLIYGI